MSFVESQANAARDRRAPQLSMKNPINRRRFIGTTLGAVAAAPFIARGAASDDNSFEMGVVADAQYADADPKGTRFYRQSIDKLATAIEHFNPRPLAFCVHLGDLIDHDWKSYDDMERPISRSRHRWHHLLGNHDFEVLDRQKGGVPKRLGMAWRYGSFDYGAFRFLILDTNDVSTYAHAAEMPEHAEAAKELARLQAANLVQAKPWNGAIGRAQMTWFERACAAARVTKRKVIVLAHHPVFPAGQHNLWNADEVLALIDKHPNVVAWLNGHNHAGNFGERNGVPFVNFHGMVETEKTNAFATARVFADRLVIEGHGREPSRELKFRA